VEKKLVFNIKKKMKTRKLPLKIEGEEGQDTQNLVGNFLAKILIRIRASNNPRSH
jgi:hypothetical protein